MAKNNIPKKHIGRTGITLFLVTLCCIPAFGAQAGMSESASASPPTAFLAETLPSDGTAVSLTVSPATDNTAAHVNTQTMSYKDFQSYLTQYLKPDSTYRVTVGMADGGTVSTYMTVPPIPSTVQMAVFVSCDCQDYNSVGNEWEQHFHVNGEEIQSGDRVTVTLYEAIEVYTEIIEFDEYNDVGEESSSRIVTQEDLVASFSIPQIVTVEEDHGQYKGHEAVWSVTYLFIPN